MFLFKFNQLEGRPTQWQVIFQNPATPIMEGITDVHSEIITYLIFIVALVAVLFIYVLICFIRSINSSNINTNSSNLKNINNNLNWQFQSIKTIKLIELVWTIVPIILLVIIALPSFSLLFSVEESLNCIPPEVTVTAVGRQWYWVYFYENVVKLSTGDITFYSITESYMIPIDEIASDSGLRLLETTEALILPNKTWVKMKITSDDVIHSWAVPALGIKTDAVPGRINTTMVYLPVTGTYYGQCSELCGVNHGYMPIKVEVILAKNFSFDIFTNVFYVENDSDKINCIVGNYTEEQIKAAIDSI